MLVARKYIAVAFLTLSFSIAHAGDYDHHVEARTLWREVGTNVDHEDWGQADGASKAYEGKSLSILGAGGAAAEGFSEAKKLHVDGSASVSSNSGTEFLLSSSIALWHDSVTLSAGHPGSLMDWNFDLDLDYLLDSTTSGPSFTGSYVEVYVDAGGLTTRDYSLELDVAGGGGFELPVHSWVKNGVLGGGAGTPSEHLAIHRTVVDSQPFNFSVVLSGGSRAYAAQFGSSPYPGDADTKFDVSHTLTYNGTTSVTDEFGNAVQDYSIASDSGTNWATPAPEPGTMAILGVGALALLKRRRK